MRRSLPPLLTALALFASAHALAATVFTLKNGATTPAVSFETREDSRWSDNWLRAPVAAGETFKMNFHTQEGDCIVRTRVRFQGGAVAEADVDYCEAKALTATEQGLSWR